MTRILVTAIAGDIGHGIGKILRRSGLAQFMVGCDVHADHAGSVYFDRCEIVERADSPGYLDSLLRVARANHIDLIVPTSEAELRFLLKAGLLEHVDAIPVIAPNDMALKVGFDKLATADFLKESGLPHPWTRKVAAGPPDRYPCLIKERSGRGSKNVVHVRREWVEFYRQTRSEDIWQECLEPADEEYTCGIYRARTGQTRTIAFRRKLAGGMTVFGRVVTDNSALNGLLVRVAEALDLRGSINAQLILTSRGPVIFEINPRFSSTVVFRHLLGFQDVIWAVKEGLGEALPEYSPPAHGTAFYRGTDEILLPPPVQPG